MSINNAIPRFRAAFAQSPSTCTEHGLKLVKEGAWAATATLSASLGAEPRTLNNAPHALQAFGVIHEKH